MTIRFACRCGKKMKTSDDKIGKKVLCSSCGSPVVVPSSNTTAVEKVTAPAVAASDTASELLRSASGVQEKQPRKNLAFDAPEDESSSRYDATETMKYYSRSFLLPAAGVLVACAIIYLMVSSITDSNPNHPPLAEVSGVITLDGQPLPGAKIIFRPRSADEKNVQISAAMGRSDENGRYRLEYVRGVYGAPLGLCTVQIVASDAEGREVIPARYRDRSHTETVQDQDNEIDFSIKLSDL